jgi:hypothetical protein
MPLRQAMSSAAARRSRATAWPTRGHLVAVPGSAGVRCVLAGRVDEVGPGLAPRAWTGRQPSLAQKRMGSEMGPYIH